MWFLRDEACLSFSSRLASDDLSKLQQSSCPPTSGNSRSVHLCPHLDKKGRDDLPAEIKTRGVDVGVAVLLESSDHRLLLTHRAGHMRTFPGIWVPPGGHINLSNLVVYTIIILYLPLGDYFAWPTEDGESLVDAVLRELNEETGLEVTEEEKKSSHILGLWESVYPPVLAMGEPKRHHVVVYLHITVSRPSQQLNKEFKLCPEEVDAAAWLSVDLIKRSVWSKDQLEKAGLEDNNDHIPITLVNQEGGKCEHLEADLDPSILTKQQEPNALTIDRISTGSRLLHHLCVLGVFFGEANILVFRSAEKIIILVTVICQ
ncbi:Nucleoside diphosphate-linked moiety X motif 17 [Portunus trituberculatus]|uniref:m7GpppN-mRNA hydrolase NUDT17 n=1 Tax=Portunus trituberculatus TaxID=210409 RepID=A0A5B7D2X0_PORTR|nr:Nucleoside diphosphate-linked moiety X motif 17 [Portunus trituberculatus]